MAIIGILRRSLSENNCCVPGAAPVSDSSASSASCCETLSCPPSPLKRQPLHIPLEVGGKDFYPVNAVPKYSQKHVSFGDLEIRKYPVILGDHPECSMGPPLTIDWEPLKSKCFSVDSYESKRGPRRNKDELQMGWLERKQVLRKLEVATDEEMRLVAYEGQRIRDQRNQTKRRLPYDLLVFAPMESLSRKIKRVLRRPSL